jgi:predicted TIM-barrel fold metal-dependent hydrolase
MIIDAHTHIIPGFNELSEVGIGFDWSDLDNWLSADSTRRCVVIPQITQFCDSAQINSDFLQKVVNFPRKHRIFPFAWIHPNQLAESYFTEQVFSGFKFHPSISQTTITENKRVLDLCDKYKKPILIHCGRGEKSRVDYILQVNADYPNLNFVCAHMGGLATDLIIRAFDKLTQAKFLDNIYLDTSGCFHPMLIRKAIQILGEDKLIFATDRPFHSFEMSLYAIDVCHFEPATRNRILYKNILDILRVKKCPD